MRSLIILVSIIFSIGIFANISHAPMVLKSGESAYIQGEIDAVSGQLKDKAPCATKQCENAYRAGMIHATQIKVLSAEFV